MKIYQWPKCPYCGIQMQCCLDKMALFCPTCKRELPREAVESRTFKLTEGVCDKRFLEGMNVRWD